MGDGDKAGEEHGRECLKYKGSSELGFLFFLLFLKFCLVLPPAVLHGEEPNREGAGVFQIREVFLQPSLDPSTLEELALSWNPNSHRRPWAEGVGRQQFPVCRQLALGQDRLGLPCLLSGKER